MAKIGGFINPWGTGHYTRMMALDSTIRDSIKDDLEIHYISSGEIYQKLLQRFSSNKEKLHNITIPTPVDGKKGPSISLSLFNFLVPVKGRPPLVRVMTNYLRNEAKLYDEQHFDLVINDGDIGSNVIAERRNIPSIFVTNQFRPRLWKSRSYFYPGLVYISKKIALASKIVVADSPPPNTICEYNLNFPEKLKKKVVYAGHFSNGAVVNRTTKSNLEKLIENVDSFGYWMITGNKSTNFATAKRYEKVFHRPEMSSEKRIVSHARHDSSLDRVTSKDGKTRTISEALEKNVDWIQIDIGFLSEQEKDTVLNRCKYAVINGSHTAMGEILGGKAKPIIGVPIYDEHTNQVKWAEERKLGILATNVNQTAMAVLELHRNYNKYVENLEEFARNYARGGTNTTTKIISQMLEN
jgi:hypothetical protein